MNGRKPCPACGSSLGLPMEYFDAVENVRSEVNKMRPAIIKDYVENDIKPKLKWLAGEIEHEIKRRPNYPNIGKKGCLRRVNDIIATLE